MVKAGDKEADLKNKIRLATILGTVQSTLTYFPYLRNIWKKNTEEERLLGVSLTGILDNPLMTNKNPQLEILLEELRQVAIDTNKEYAVKLGINPATAITCVKPSGTVSQLVDSASGIHPRHSAYYIRTVRGDNKDPLTQFMKDSGIPFEKCVSKPENTSVFSFPIKAPQNSVFRHDLTAIEHLNLWMTYQKSWCEHKPSVTISVKEDEWMEVGAYVYKHFNEISGVSFLPFTEHSYQQAPYQEIDEAVYQELLKASPTHLEWDKLHNYEREDNTAGSQTYACSGDSCEIVDLTR